MAAVNVPLVTRRQRIPLEAIEDVVRQIAKQFKPRQIILFGSYARGDFRPQSDVDLLVVMETHLKPVRQEVLISQSIEFNFGLDVLVYTPEMLKERLDLGDSFLRKVMREGKVLYESAG